MNREHHKEIEYILMEKPDFFFSVSVTNRL